MASDPISKSTSQKPLQEAAVAEVLPAPETDVLPDASRPAFEISLRAAVILENVVDAFIALDRQWRILYANREACRINQKPREEFIGRIHWKEWPAAVGTELERQFRRVMAERVEAHFEHRYVSGPYDVWLEIDAYPSEDGINLFYRDITGRKRAEEALRASERRFRLMADAIPHIAWTTGPDGAVDYYNQRWYDYSGLTFEETRDWGWATVIHPDDLGRAGGVWQAAIQAGAVSEVEYRLRRADGTYRLHLGRSVPVREGDEVVKWVGTATDIEDHHLVEEELRQSAARQRQFLRDVLASVTEGRLLLCDTAADLPAPPPPLGPLIPLSMAGGVRELRQATQEACQAVGFPDERCYDLVTAVSEAGMNAAVHVGSGEGQVHVDAARGAVQVRVADSGSGIAVEDLPHATLMKGYSSAGTLGHGMKMMLQTADRVYLLTGPSGTTVLLEMDRVAPPPAWL